MAYLTYQFAKFSTLLISMALLACSTPKMNISVDDFSMPFGHIPDTHTATENDNLFKVAMKYGMDYNELGKLNGIPYPYTLTKGQTVYLNKKTNTSAKPSKLIATVTSGLDNLQTSTPAAVDKPNPPAKADAAEKPATEKPFVSTSRIERKTKTKYGIAWQRPMAGEVSKGYKDLPSSYKGIDVPAPLNTPIYAAADGIVSYSGDDALSKYGKLIIINHEDIILSAYAHLNRLLVDEGEEVHRGQLIAQSGKTGTSTAKLHFEIRKDGEPVDPETVLPR